MVVHDKPIRLLEKPTSSRIPVEPTMPRSCSDWSSENAKRSDPLPNRKFSTIKRRTSWITRGGIVEGLGEARQSRYNFFIAKKPPGELVALV